MKPLQKMAWLGAFCMMLGRIDACAAVPETIRFSSNDGATELVGYLYKPQGAGPHAAIVMLHGRAGAYSALKRGVHAAEALSARHRMWGEFWASRGFVALLVDSFGPRGYGDGFPKHSYKQRPAAVSERFVRPHDAYGALRFLRSRPDVIASRIGLHGWSNGGMTVLAAIDSDAAAVRGGAATDGFAAAIAQYPNCRAQSRQPRYKPVAPLLILAAAADDEVSPELCRELASGLRERGAPVEFVVFEGAHHAYDDPGKTKQSHAPNREALQDTLSRALAFFQRHLGQMGQ